MSDYRPLVIFGDEVELFRLLYPEAFRSGWYWSSSEVKRFGPFLSREEALASAKLTLSKENQK